MNTTYNIELNSRPDSAGRHSVMVRIHQKGYQPGRVLTGIKIEKAAQFWNQKKEWGKWVVKSPDSKALNTRIEKEYRRIQDQCEKYLSTEVLTPQMLADRCRGDKSGSYFTLLDQVLDDSKEQAYATLITRRSASNLFRKFLKSDVPVASVSVSVAQSFQQYLRKTPTAQGKKRKASSINKYFDNMHVIHCRILAKTGVSSKQAAFLSPFTDVDKLPEMKAKKARFNQESIAELTTGSRSVATTRRSVTPESAFHIWLLSSLLAGMRFGDVLQLRYRNFDIDQAGEPVHLRYEMVKTGNWVSIPVLEQARVLLKLYWNSQAKPTEFILPYLKNDRSYASILTYDQYRAADFTVKRRLYNDLAHWNRQVNLCLKMVQDESGITERLSVHTARHSFAELARKIMQEDKSITAYDIQLMMGHSSIKTTEGYYNDGENQNSTDAMNAVFGKKG